MQPSKAVWRLNVRSARSIWTDLSRSALDSLKDLTKRYALSVAAGDLQYLEGRWYVTHAGLLRIAQRRRCSGIRSFLQRDVSDPSANRWVFKATVYKTPSSKGFVGYGDADPSNVSPRVRGAEMRVAETRAVNRALRKAYGIGLCSVDELGSPGLDGNGWRSQARADQDTQRASSNSQPRLRDRLCLLIRQHRLDPSLVKQYALEFCGAESLRQASRERIQEFIEHLAEWAARDGEGLFCHLNRYAPPQEVKP